LFEGDFEDTYITGDNSKVIPTDTIKNTVYIVAHKHKFSSPEEFSLHLCQHFLKEYSWVESVHVKITVNLWERMQIGGVPHEHSFSQVSPEKRITHVISSRKSPLFIESGITNLIVLKTTGSGFVGYHKDENTTLQETTDRIFSTSVTCKWKFNTKSSTIDFNKYWEGAKKIIYERFALEYSKSVQETLRKIGDNIVNNFPEIDEVHLVMPNRHAFQFNLTPFGLPNTNTIFQPIREPAGMIEGTITRRASLSKL